MYKGMDKRLRIISIMIISVFIRAAHRLLTDQLNNSVTQYPKCSFTRWGMTRMEKEEEGCRYSVAGRLEGL